MLKLQLLPHAMPLLALIPTLAAAQNAPQDVSDDPRVVWLQEHAHPLRSIDPDDEDFTDLEPLRPALKDVRVVLLGEADHRSGSDFLAKTRLVKFLHQELGFDLLAFEAPIYDMAVAGDSMRAGMAARDAFWLGASTWAGWAQMQPLVEYLGEHSRGARPFEIAGFDHQHTLASAFYFVDDLAEFLGARGLGGPLVDPGSPEQGVLRALAQVQYRYRVAARPDVSIRRAFLTAVERALASVSAMPDERASHWAQVLRNLACHTRFVLSHPDIGNCVRDEQMAENVLWMVNERYPDRKIVVWAATAHAARLARLPPGAGGGPSMAVRIGEALGPESYAIGVTSYAGDELAIVTDQDSMPEFEELMEAAGFEYGILDLRGAAREGGWASGEFPARPIGHTTQRAVWSDVLDALLFVRQQRRSRELEQPAAEIQAITEVRESETAAVVEGTADAFAALFTDDCLVTPPGGPSLTNRGALRAWLENLHERFAFVSGDTEPLATFVVGDRAWELYTATGTVIPKAGGEASEQRHRGMHIYRRQPDGRWRIAEDAWNPIRPRGGG